ncbi:hypothetical protein CapIbe_018346 [Capra ibex]
MRYLIAEEGNTPQQKPGMSCWRKPGDKAGLGTVGGAKCCGLAGALGRDPGLVGGCLPANVKSSAIMSTLSPCWTRRSSVRSASATRCTS